MEGQVKITVIATGFDHNRAARRDKDTPTDMSAYTNAARVQAEDRLVAAAGGQRFARRPVLDLSKLPFTPVSDPEAAAADDTNPLDLPTFMRRQEG
jgi:hypothetical protein